VVNTFRGSETNRLVGAAEPAISLCGIDFSIIPDFMSKLDDPLVDIEWQSHVFDICLRYMPYDTVDSVSMAMGERSRGTRLRCSRWSACSSQVPKRKINCRGRPMVS
jgi:hypothetical protein